MTSEQRSTESKTISQNRKPPVLCLKQPTLPLPGLTKGIPGQGPGTPELLAFSGPISTSVLQSLYSLLRFASDQSPLLLYIMCVCLFSSLSKRPRTWKHLGKRPSPTAHPHPEVLSSVWAPLTVSPKESTGRQRCQQKSSWHHHSYLPTVYNCEHCLSTVWAQGGLTNGGFLE